MLHVHPIAYQVAQVLPFLRVFHYVTTALRVVIVHADGTSDVLLRNAEFLLHAQLHGESVRVPSGLTLHEEALHGLVPANHVLDGARHHVVNARVAVGRGRALKKNERGGTLPFRHTLVKQIGLVPFLQDLLINLVEVQIVMFGKFHSVSQKL